MGGVFCNGTVGKRQGSSWTARASGAHVGMLEEPVFSDFSFDFVNRVISIRLIGIETRWKKGEGFRELKPDGRPYERPIDPRVVKVFKRLLARDAEKGNENAKRMIAENLELMV